MTTRDEFTNQLIRFCATNGIMTVPARPPAEQQSDLDIIINASSVQKIVAWIEGDLKLTITSRYARSDGGSVFLYGLDDPKGRGFGIDFLTQLSFRGIPYRSVDSVLLRADVSKSIPALDPIDQSVILLMTHGIKHKGHLKPEYIDFLIQTRKQQETAFLSEMIGLFGDEGGLDVLDSLKAREFPAKTARKLGRRYVLQALKRNTLETVFNHGEYLIKETRNRFSMPRTTIAFYGIDGAGKTTLINSIKEDLAGTSKIIRHCHLLPLFPVQSEPDSNKAVAAPHSKKPRHFITSTGKIFYYLAYYWLAALWPQRSGSIILYDRHMTDMLVDPRRSRYGGSMKLLKWVCRLLPRVDARVFVDTDPAIANKRKPETDIRTATYLAQGYKSLAQHQTHVLIVNGTAPQDINRKTVVKHIIGVMQS